MSVWDKIRSTLRDHGAEIVRTKKHVVWRFPDGRIWVHASTPSDVKAGENNYRDLRKFLGLNGSNGNGEIKNPSRVTKTRKRKKNLTKFVGSGILGSRTLQEQLKCKFMS